MTLAQTLTSIRQRKETLRRYTLFLVYGFEPLHLGIFLSRLGLRSARAWSLSLPTDILDHGRHRFARLLKAGFPYTLHPRRTNPGRIPGRIPGRMELATNAPYAV